MSGRTIKWLVISLGLLIIFSVSCSSVVSLSNKEVVLRAKFKQKTDERTAFYDKMWKTISQKGQIAVKNDSSFHNNIEAIMAARKDAQGLFMKWVQESNPNANYEQVSLLYQDLSRAVEAEREGFFQEEKTMQDVVNQHDITLNTFPGGWILTTFMGRKHLSYKPITSDRTDGVIKSGKDNDTKVFQ